MGISDVINSVILELQKIFGDDYTYYDENIGQGMELPCFFVQHINLSENYLVGIRYEVTSNFVIHGHVENSLDRKSKLNKMETDLYNLEYITLSNGDLIRLENRNSKIEDNEVFFYFDVKVHLFKKPEEEENLMKEIDMNEGVIEDG